MSRASPMSQVAKTRTFWLMRIFRVRGECGDSRRRPEQCIAATGGRDARDPELSLLLFLTVGLRRSLTSRDSLRVVPHVGSQHPEDHIFGDVGGMVRDALQVACNK